MRRGMYGRNGRRVSEQMAIPDAPGIDATFVEEMRAGLVIGEEHQLVLGMGWGGEGEFEA